MVQNPAANINHSKAMSSPGLRRLAVHVLAALVVGAGSTAFAQANGDAKNKDQPKAEPPKTEAIHLAEVARQVKGPAGHPECAHLGENAISLMMRNDVDAAARHMDIYDRFGCPGAYVRDSLRCALLIGTPVTKDSRSLEDVVRTCWLNPAATSATPAPPQPGAPAPPQPAAPVPPAPPGTGAH
jgi:hypothetical protein